MSHVVPTSLLTAVRLKEAMKQVPSFCPSIGSVVRVPFASFNLDDFTQDQNEPASSSDSASSASSSSSSSESEEHGATSSSSTAVTSTGKSKLKRCKKGFRSPRVLTHRFYARLQQLLVPASRKSVDDIQIKEILVPTKKTRVWRSCFYEYKCLLKCAVEQFWLFVSIPGQADCDYSGPITGINEELLKKWWEHGHVSGYGNVRTQTTDVDASVRNAREWRGDEISVSEQVNDTLALLWSKAMQPAEVRVQLYKLNVYGPGGRFIAHKDTPETDLIGTILIGLGDTTDEAAGLKVEGRRSLWRASPAAHIMFYPDVPHEVLTVTSGYRATLAFKVFRGRDQNDLSLNNLQHVLREWWLDYDNLFEEYISEDGLISNMLRKWYPNYESDSSDCDDDSRPQLTDAQKAEVQAEVDRYAQQKRSVILDCFKRYNTGQDEESTCSGSSSGRKKPVSSTRSGDPVAAAATSYSSLQTYLCEKLKVNLATRRTPFGFLLDSQYALGTKDLHGPDQVLYEILSGFPHFRVIVLPVLTEYKASLTYEYEYGSDDRHNHEESAVVYPLTDAHVRGVLDKEVPNLASACGISQAEADQMKNVPIVALDLRNGYEWYQSLEGSEYTGNESQAEVENSVWLHRALIVVRRSGENDTGSSSSSEIKRD